ncbi:MAG TPA: hypothetical protein VIQ74_05485 [Gemmatimonadaceae bacterium]
MSGRIVTGASVVIPLPGKHVDAEDIVSNRELANTLRAATIAFARTIEKYLAEEDR